MPTAVGKQRREIMGCARRSVRTSDDFIAKLTNLEQTGRLHFFYHSPVSSLPVRDVLNKQHHGYKTEPYIEKSAENYCCECNQASIRGFLRSSEKYLFLTTTCRNKESGYEGKICVVGYIVKRKHVPRRPGLHAVTGDMRLYPFRDSYKLEMSASRNNPRQLPKKCDERTTGRIRNHFKRKRNILGLCRTEIENLKKRLPAVVRKEQARQCM